MINFEEIDLAEVTRNLLARLGRELPDDYLDGRTVIRDALEAQLGCSALEAEDLVETLESREYLRFPKNADNTHPNQPSRWIIAVPSAER